MINEFDSIESDARWLTNRDTITRSQIMNEPDPHRPSVEHNLEKDPLTTGEPSDEESVEGARLRATDRFYGVGINQRWFYLVILAVVVFFAIWLLSAFR
jgi:hypothetical protein